MDRDHRLRLAIVGGGIGGLSVAVALAKLVPNHERHIRLDIYESTASLQAQVGAGIGVWPRSWSVLQAMGIDEELLKYTEGEVVDEPVETFMFRRADEEHGGRNLFTVWTGSGSLLFFHRGDFQAVLLRNTPSNATIHTKKRLRSYEQRAQSIRLEFEDGTFGEADLVIGADGLQSRVRRSLVEEIMKRSLPSPPTSPLSEKPSTFLSSLTSNFTPHAADPLWTGRIAYRALIDRQRLLDAGWKDHRVFKGGIHYLGKNGFIIAFPVSNGAKVNVAAYRIWHDLEDGVYSDAIVDELLRKEAEAHGGFDLAKAQLGAVATTIKADSEGGDPWAENGGGGRIASGRARWVSRVSAEQVKVAFAGWEPEVQVLINGMDSALRWAVHAVRPVDTFVDKHVCVLGDAAHAMHPHQGAGAGQSIDDAYVLSSLLASAIASSSSPGHLKASVPAILEAYDLVRRPTAQDVCRKSRSHAFLFTFRLPHEAKWRSVDRDDEIEMKEVERRMNADWEWTWDRAGSLEEAKQAVKIFQEKLQSGNR